MAHQAKIGRYGAFPVKDDRYDYYLVRWTHEPFEVAETRRIKVGDEEVNVTKGDWVCKGHWLDLVPGRGRNWWYQTTQECIVRMQTVVDADVELKVISADNPLPNRMLVREKEFARTHNAMSVSEELHDLLVGEATRREAFDHMEYYEVTSDDACDTESDEEFCDDYLE